MEDQLRKRILDNIDNLVACTEYYSLLSACIRNGLISDDMTQGIENIVKPSKQPRNQDVIERERHKRLFAKITKRGPDAYDCLIKVLLNLDNEQALRILARNENDNHYKSLSGKFQPQLPTSLHTAYQYPHPNNAMFQIKQSENYGLGNPIENHPKLELYVDIPKRNKTIVKKAQTLKKGNDIYSMKSKENRGILFMVNIIEFPDKSQRRNGAEEDSDFLLHVFKEFGFKIFSYENLTEKQFFNFLHQLLNSDHVRQTECFTLALMTHGELQTHVEYAQFHDGEMVRLSRIMDAFHLDDCPNLKNKPKIFIFPFCRGDKVEKSKAIETDSVSSGKSNLNDIIVCYATNIGFKSHRDPISGSFYIQKLCANLATHAWEKSLEDILKKTHRDVSDDKIYKQNGSYVNLSFNKSFYFNPGIYED